MPCSRRSLIITLLSFTITCLLWTAAHLANFHVFPSLPNPRKLPKVPSNKAKLHFLIVATADDVNLCRLLLSASILSYPPPILIDWKGQGKYDAKETHLAKIAGAVRYLETLPPAQDHDLVLMVDGYDVLLQLRPDVLLKRYANAVKTAEVNLLERHGAAQTKEHNIHNSIFFGPDKVCWPDKFNRAACWAVPQSPLPKYAFGPYTDRFLGDMPHARPRWLNSGTIIGPVRDLRTMFQATMDLIDLTYDANETLRNSDQMYLADLWARQELARIMSLGGNNTLDKPETIAIHDLPLLKTLEEEDFHVGLDYDSSMFQTAAGYSQFLASTMFNRSAMSSQQRTIEAHKIELSQDILDSRKPKIDITEDEILRETSWRQVPLAVNTVSGWIPTLLHFTGDKSRREEWWERMWYSNEVERLHNASIQTYADEISSELINGVRWSKHRPNGQKREFARPSWRIWSDRNEALSWDVVCHDHGQALFSGGNLS